MPAAKYREKLVVIDALQYTGTNKDEMIAFGGPHISEKDGQLRLEVSLGSKLYQPINATDWVYLDPRQKIFGMTNTDFQLQFQPGGGPA